VPPPSSRGAAALLASLSVPVVAAPMAGASGGALAAAVTRAGALGMIGAGGQATSRWLSQQAETARGAGDFGVGLLAWTLPQRRDLLEATLVARPVLVSISYGPYEQFVQPLREAGIVVATQVGTVEEALRAVDAGVDVVVARGSEGGGHGRSDVATLPLLQLVLDRVDLPVLAAGGICGPRGVAAVLAAGAAGAWVGTAFLLCAEATTPQAARDRLLQAGAHDTEYSSLFDRGQRTGWPAEYGGRYLRSPFTDSWSSRVDEIGSDDEAVEQIASARERGDGEALPVYAGQAVGSLDAGRPAAEVVADLGSGVDVLAGASRRWVRSRSAG